ncbi:MAG TPA: penicillin-binding transpeptidase domain-containing protein [Streptosporangiaceae bacterium]|nr:penicillin-binding transpeptidase domain-containing protein [Streptosporangiaceae bacterium]
MRWARSCVVLASAGALLGAGTLLAGCASGSTPQQTARSYLADWARRDWRAMRGLAVRPPASFAAVNAAALADLDVQRASYQAGRMRVSGGTATEPVAEHLQIAGIGTVTIKTVLRLSDSSSTWLVDWSPATIAPQLRPGDQLSLQVDWPPRAQILGAGGAALTTQAALVTVGVEGQRIKDASAVRATLVAAGAPASAVAQAMAGAKSEPTWFEPVYTISWARYLQLKPKIYPIPGTVFQTVYQRTPITPGLGYVVGSVGPITAQQLHELGPPYTASSVVGQTGLEAAYQRQLAGQAGATVTATNSSGAALATVAALAPRPGTPVQTSIDPTVQRDAEAALAGESKQAALVAVDAATGQVLASVSLPASAGFNLALDGAFPPGSAFKIITSTALIEHGLGPSSAASCPPELTVDGEDFHNSEGTAPISDLLNAFAESCNTAFIGLATRHLAAADFPATAAQYRIGTAPELGLPAYGGSVPAPTDEADLAATAIGQSRVLVSPLDMAMVAAAVDTGQVRAPRLVAGAADDQVTPTALAPAVVADLHTMMAQVVATGTASGKGLPPGTYAKTGTAQFGSGNPLPQDAWLVGFNGDIAFAMVVIDGGEGGPTDGPLVARFLDLVRSGTGT